MSGWDEVDQQIISSFPGGEPRLNKMKADVDLVFQKCDKDSSGTLDKEELKAWMSGHIHEWAEERHVPEEELQARMQKFDSDNDGHLTKAEVYLTMRRIVFGK